MTDGIPRSRECVVANTELKSDLSPSQETANQGITIMAVSGAAAEAQLGGVGLVRASCKIPVSYWILPEDSSCLPLFRRRALASG